ncbi:MAG: hypothetical protein ACYTFY_16500 [Planctomycetota bacterium]|jgi:hypothetical protein
MQKTTAILITIIILFTLAATTHCGEPKNILWDGGFKTGFGNACWGVTLGTQGPNLRSIWHSDYVTLKQTIATRIYHLPEGKYAFAAWARKAKGYSGDDPVIKLFVSNRNHHRDRKRNEYSNKFTVTESTAWQKFGFTFEVKNPVRSGFHARIIPYTDDAVEIDHAVLIRADAPPEKRLYAADIFANFNVPEETGIYVDGQKRDITLMVCNNTPQEQKAKVNWQIFNHREELVVEGHFEELWPADKITVKSLPLDNLPWEGYRFACEVEGQEPLGDALAAFLPKSNSDRKPLWGGDATFISPTSTAFTINWMKKMGARLGGNVSCGAKLSRWMLCEPNKGEILWHDEIMNQIGSGNIDMYTCLNFKMMPYWARFQFFETKGDPKRPQFIHRDSYRDIKDLEGLTKAVSSYAERFAEHYGEKCGSLLLCDEVNYQFPSERPEAMKAIAKIYMEARAAIKAVAKRKGIDIPVSINSSFPKWWKEFIKYVPKDSFDFVSSNSVTRPRYATGALNELKAAGIHPEIYQTSGVGQMGKVRKTSLILDRKASLDNPPGLFARQFIIHQWLGRPYGKTKAEDGPIIHFQYYTFRALAQCVYLPLSGKSGLEYDNSPNLGMQAITMSRYAIEGMSSVRDSTKPYTVPGYPTASEGYSAYPFRDKEKAVVFIFPEEDSAVDRAHKLVGKGLTALDFRGLYDNKLKGHNEDGVKIDEFPVMIRCTPDKLDQIMQILSETKVELVPGNKSATLKIGPYTVNIDPESEGLLRISKELNGETMEIISGISTSWKLKGLKIDLQEGRLYSTVNIRLHHPSDIYLAVKVSKHNVSLKYNERRTDRKDTDRRISFKVSQNGANKPLVLKQFGKVLQGKMRDDYGVFFPDADSQAIPPLPLHSGSLDIDNFASFIMPVAEGNGLLSPPQGFIWKYEDGQAFIEGNYRIRAYQGGGSKGVQNVRFELTIE